MYILAWKAARLVCSALSTVLDMLRPLIVAWLSPVQLRIMNGRKMTRVASSSTVSYTHLTLPTILLV